MARTRKKYLKRTEKDWETLFPADVIRAGCRDIQDGWDDATEAKRRGAEHIDTDMKPTRIVIPLD